MGPNMLFNALEYVTEATKKDRIAALNGANLPKIRNFFFPPRDDSIFDSISKVLNSLELDEHLALLAPTYKHSKESTGHLFVQSLKEETLRKFGQPNALPNIASLCKRVSNKSF